jgi:hypothetical protein
MYEGSYMGDCTITDGKYPNNAACMEAIMEAEEAERNEEEKV